MEHQFAHHRAKMEDFVNLHSFVIVQTPDSMELYVKNLFAKSLAKTLVFALETTHATAPM